jgi:hypothetical protein
VNGGLGISGIMASGTGVGGRAYGFRRVRDNGIAVIAV